MGFGLHQTDEVSNGDLQSGSKLEDGLDARRVESAFEQGDVVALQVGVESKRLLRQPALVAQLPQDDPKGDFWLHSPPRNCQEGWWMVACASSQYTGHR